MARHGSQRTTRVARRERAALVGLIPGSARRLEAERSLDELAGLAEAAGAEVVLRVLQERPKPDPSTYLGSGKITLLAGSCAETGVDLVIVGHRRTKKFALRWWRGSVDSMLIDRVRCAILIAGDTPH